MYYQTELIKPVHEHDWRMLDATLFGEPVSALLIDSNNSIIAGGWNGILTKWSAEGDEVWSIQLPDRIGSISVTENAVYVCRVAFSCCKFKSRRTNLAACIRGSADEVTTFNGLIYATSSVYDIEHNDFIDSAIWCFDSKGESLGDSHG